LIASGLHPFSAWHQQVVSPGERYAEIVERIQWPVRRLMTQGVHYHVGVRSAERALAITTALTSYLPHFLALSASSPWWHGIDTGLASARSKVFEAMPSTGLPPQFDGWADFESFMATLIRVGSITTIREVWWDVRPHPDFGTVELRMCDAMPTLRETCALAALAQSLVESFERRLDAGDPLPRPREWLVRENKWRAVRYGMDAVLVLDEAGASAPVPDAVARLVDDVRPVAVDLGCAAELADVLAMLEWRPSYARQRDVVAGGGTLTDVVHSLRRELVTDRPGA
jgi:carboxylate-amine ligase